MADVNELDPIHGNDRHNEAFALSSAFEDVGATTRAEISSILQRNALQDVEIGLERLDYDDGRFQLYVDSTGVVSTSGISTNYGLESNGAGFVSLSGGSVSGTVTHTERDYGFIPTSIVLVDRLVDPLPADADVEYEVSDSNGNTQTIPRGSLDEEVDLTGFETYNITVTAILTRTSDTVESPKLAAWTVYFQGQVPAEYVEITNVTLAEV